MKYLLKFVLVISLIGLIINASWAVQKAVDIETKQQSDNTHEAQNEADHYKKKADKLEPLFPAKVPQNPDPKTAKNPDQTEDKGTEFWPPLNGYRLKITDTLLVVFTCLLFLATVGLWRATRNLVIRTDKMNRNTERAFLIGGGPEVFIKIGESVARREDSIITIHNAGRTPGFCTKLQWAICDEKDFLPNKRVSQILDEHTIKSIDGNIIEENNVWPAGEKFGLDHFKITNHESHIGRILFGRVDFKDIFGDMHYSTFKLKLIESGSRTLPGSYSDDWE